MNPRVVEIARSARVPAPADQVWAVVSDARRAPDWFSLAERTDVLSGEGVGQLRRQHGRWGNRVSEIDQEVTDFDPGRLIAWKHVDERLDGRPAPKFAAASVFRIELEPDGDGTVVRLRAVQQPAGFWQGLVMRVGTRHISARMEEALARLPGAVLS